MANKSVVSAMPDVEKAAMDLLVAEREAERLTRENKRVADAAAVQGSRDAVVKGTIDLWPLLRLETEALVAKIAGGECDGVLSELGEMAAAHPVRGPRGETVTRQTVIDAVKARLRKA